MSERSPIKEMLSGWDAFDRPKDGQIFEHYKGGSYEIIATGFYEDNHSPCIVYRSNSDSTIWVRTAQNFLETVEYEGTLLPRFSPVEE